MHNIKKYLSKVKLPDPDSHKGQNGKLMIIGGSELFHAASRWSLDIASKFVDMVFYSSIPINNELIKEAKGNFWNGMVVNPSQRADYIKEADAVLIGPGMERTQETKAVIDDLLTKYPDKKWVIDAGALQMMEPNLLNKNCIITPHHQELDLLLSHLSLEQLLGTDVTILLKGAIDQVMTKAETIEIAGGNAGMTKGGTGDVLAGLVSALYCTHDALTSAVAGSYFNKKAGESLFTKVGPYFNASDLVTAIPEVAWQQLSLL